MTNLTKSAQKTNSDLLLLFMSAGFDKKRIVIAEHELSANFLTLYLEDIQDFKSDIEETLMYKLPIKSFCEIIEKEGLNSYTGVCFTESGGQYEGRVVINKPVKWFLEDATLYQQKCCLETVVEYILKSLTK